MGEMSREEAIKNLNIILDSAQRRTRRNIVIPDLIEAIKVAIEDLKAHDELCENLAWYINERQRLLKVIEYSKPHEGLQRTIKRALERPHGEWKDLSDGWQEGTYECSNCKTEFVLIEGTPEDNEYNFCPNCGADMRNRGEAE